MCKVCIEPWLLKNNSCPICRNKKPVLELPSKFIMRLFDNVVIECSNKQNGCKEKIIYGNLEKHLNVCVYKTKISSCENCKDEIVKLLKNVDNLESQLTHLKNTIEFNKKCNFDDDLNNIILEKIKFSLNTHKHFLYPIHRKDFVCNGGCNTIFRNTSISYYCSECELDICEKCFNSSFFKWTNRFDKHIHTLEPLYILSQKYECDRCNHKFGGDNISFRCDQCDFDLCWQCYWC